ncbi:MAG: CPBP family intramembrane metalloprotease [Verrucomicrobia bacterium]|nr:CPBP family intramembrane metalloprotease [Verrucomicrobiota bacterium]
MELPPVLPPDESAPPPVTPVPSMTVSSDSGSAIWMALALTVIYVVLLIVLQSVLTVVLMVLKLPPPGAVVTTVLMFGAFGVTLGLTPLLTGLPIRELLPGRPGPAAAIPGAVLLALGGWIGALEIGALTEQVMPMPEWIAREFERLFQQSHPVASLVLLTVAPPIVEEALCRGLLLRAMLKRWSVTRSVVVSALVFGGIHLNPWQFFYATWLGLLLGWVYVRTRSLGLCVLLHALNNFLSWVLMRAQPEWAGSGSAVPEHLPVGWAAAGVALLMGGVLWLRKVPVVGKAES